MLQICQFLPEFELHILNARNMLSINSNLKEIDFQRDLNLDADLLYLTTYFPIELNFLLIHLAF